MSPPALDRSLGSEPVEDSELDANRGLDEPLVVAVDLVRRPVVGRAKARVPGRQPVRIERAVRAELRVADGLIGRAVVLDLALTTGNDRRVEHVVGVEPQLQLT